MNKYRCDHYESVVSHKFPVVIEEEGSQSSDGCGRAGRGQGQALITAMPPRGHLIPGTLPRT